MVAKKTLNLIMPVLFNVSYVTGSELYLTGLTTGNPNDEAVWTSEAQCTVARLQRNSSNKVRALVLPLAINKSRRKLMSSMPDIYSSHIAC